MTTIAKSVDKWKALPWKKFRKIVFRLQTRIYKAQKMANYKLVRSLQKLLLSSQAAKYLAVRQVTQLNQGKRTAGVDGVIALSPKQRLELAKHLHIDGWQHSKLRRVWIPKSNGEKRGLGIPTIYDRAMQCLVKLALEPTCEAYFSGNSYGFRIGRSTKDVQKQLFINLSSNAHGIKKRIFEMDIEKCFDRVDHEFLMKQISLPPKAKLGIYRAIKAGVLNERSSSEEGTPQGGVISPLLANIALHGLEDIGRHEYRRWNKKEKIDVTNGVGFRYADDCVFILQPNEDANALKQKIEEFLKIRGLNVKEAKTRLIDSTDGFDFLGFNFMVRKDGRFISTPTKKGYEKVKDEIKRTLKDSRFTLEERIKKVASIVRGWRNYHCHCDMTEFNLWYSSKWAWKFVHKQSRRAKKKKTKVAVKVRKEQTDQAIARMFPKVSWSVNTFVNVIGAKSPYDGDLVYWSKRNSVRYDGATAEALKRQKHKCSDCGLSFLSGDTVELHHVDGNHNNWKTKNLVALHRGCHQRQEIHTTVRKNRKVSKS